MAVHEQPSSALSTDLIYTDDLTGLRNRRFLYQVFGEGWSEVTGSGSEMALAIVDLDFFKQVNDIHGHLTGDLVLAETASLLQGFLGEEDHAIRYGGDEFVLLLPKRSKAESLDLVERLRSTMADKEFVSKEENQPLETVLSFSIGVAIFPADGSSGEELMAAADKALYASKKGGRNCVTMSGELPAGLEDEIDKFRTFPCKTLVGRQDVIETLAGLCELVNLGTGTWTALYGPAGIGKTRLLQEALRLGLDSGLLCSVIQLSEDEAAQPYSGVARILSEIGLRYPQILSEVVRDSPADLAQFLRVHAAETVASLVVTDEDVSSQAPEMIRNTLLETFVKLGRKYKWLFVLDEVSYLDPHSGELLSAMVETERLPVGIVSAHRDADAASAALPGILYLDTLGAKPWFDRRSVQALSLDAIDVLISVLLPNLHAPAEFSRHIYDVTSGNPLFVEELLRIGIARETITRRGGEWFVQLVDRRDLPATLEEAIGERMAALEDEIGEGIARVAAMGNSLTPEVLQALLGKNEGEILDFLDQARDQGIIKGGQHGDLRGIHFAGSTIRDQAYGQMTDVDRTRAHREIGKIEEHRAGSLVDALASRLAYHFERGEVYEKAKAYLAAAESSAPPIIVAGSWDEAEVPTHRRRRIAEAAIPLREDAWPSFDSALRSIVQASKSLWMYPEGSPIADAAIEELQQQLENLLEQAEVVSLATVEDTLVVNGIPYPARKQETLVRGLLDELKARGIRGFTIRRGITHRETVFLVSQLASHGPIDRDPEAWDELLAEKGIENVDFGDRVYVPAEGVVSAPMAPAEMRGPQASIIRVASAEEMRDLAGDQPGIDAPGVSHAATDDAEPGLPDSSDDLKSLLSRLGENASIDDEIQTFVPMVADLLRKLLESADEEARIEHRELAAAVGLVGSGPRVEEDDYLGRLLVEQDSRDQRSLLAPARERFEVLVHARDFENAGTVLRFLRLCQVWDEGDGELALESQMSLASIAAGGAVQLLLEDLLARSEWPDHDALGLLGDLGTEGGMALVTFLRETDDLRARRAVARLLKEIGGEPQKVALESVTHGDNPVVARRVIGVLDYLSPDLTGDLTRAITVRNPGVLGETIKILQRQPRPIQMQVIGSLLGSASAELVSRGVYYLSEWNLREASGTLLMLFRESEDYEVLAAVTAAAARWRLPEAVPILAELLRRKQVMRIVPVFPRGLRREFARALAAIGTPEAKRQLAEFSKDLDPEVRNISRGMPAPTGA